MRQRTRAQQKQRTRKAGFTIYLFKIHNSYFSHLTLENKMFRKSFDNCFFSFIHRSVCRTIASIQIEIEKIIKKTIYYNFNRNENKIFFSFFVNGMYFANDRPIIHHDVAEVCVYVFSVFCHD